MHVLFFHFKTSVKKTLVFLIYALNIMFYNRILHIIREKYNNLNYIKVSIIPIGAKREYL